MKKLFNLSIAVTLLYALASLFYACSEEADCSLTDNRGMIVCNVCQIDPTLGTAIKDTLDSLTITAYGTDSVIVNNQKEVKDLTLPLRYTEDSTVLIFRYNEGV